jgi:hypothetical protein
VESSFGSFSVFVRAYIENGVRRWYDIDNKGRIEKLIYLVLR